MDIMKMSVQDLMLFRALDRLAIEADKASDLIKKNFKNSFGPDDTEIHVYHVESLEDYHGDWYLTINGILKYQDNWNGGRTYSFPCSSEGIYHMLRSCYLRDKNLADIDPVDFDCQITFIDSHFRKFIKSLSIDD